MQYWYSSISITYPLKKKMSSSTLQTPLIPPGLLAYLDKIDLGISYYSAPEAQGPKHQR